MKVFSDKHHEGLTKSLYLLFEDRLGYELYTPLGMDWWTEGFWKLNDIEATATQYLQMGSQPYPGYAPLTHDRPITLDGFKNTKFDIIIASLPQHIEPFIRLRDLYQPQAKLIFQVGNHWNFDNSFPIKNIMASAKIPKLEGFNQIEYHQEFPLDIFYYEPVKPGKKIYSFINCLGVVDLYKKDWELFLELEKLMPDWEFKSFGGQCRDSALLLKDQADKMREATFIFHKKSGSDGYGHVIHQAMATGRVPLINYKEYKDKLAGSKIIPGMNCISLDDKTPAQIVEEIERCSEISVLTEMGADIYNKFKEQANFDREQVQIQNFLSNLQ